MSTATKTVGATGDSTAGLPVDPGETIYYKGVVSNTDSADGFIGTLQVSLSEVGDFAYTSEVLTTYTGAVASELTGTAFNTSYTNLTTERKYLRITCPSFDGDNNSDDIVCTVSHTAFDAFTDGGALTTATLDDNHYNKTVTNAGAVATATFTLPAVSGVPANTTITFEVHAAQSIVITPNASDKIFPVTVADAESLTSSTIGDTITLRRMDATGWHVDKMVGNWHPDTVALTTATLNATHYNKVITNAGSVATATLTLPAVSGVPAGTTFTFEVHAAQLIVLQPDAGDTIFPIGEGDGEWIRSNTIGSRITIKAMDSTGWIITDRQGYWQATKEITRYDMVILANSDVETPAADGAPVDSIPYAVLGCQATVNGYTIKDASSRLNGLPTRAAEGQMIIYWNDVFVPMSNTVVADVPPACSLHLQSAADGFLYTNIGGSNDNIIFLMGTRAGVTADPDGLQISLSVTFEHDFDV